MPCTCVERQSDGAFAHATNGCGNGCRQGQERLLTSGVRNGHHQHRRKSHREEEEDSLDTDQEINGVSKDIVRGGTSRCRTVPNVVIVLTSTVLAAPDPHLPVTKKTGGPPQR
ncbi:hypothetical protein EVAR_41438_1 [Eumeta japonica]|uniref:Uncharacterized protein n=1 Tax=Eumeta variegata TaxID=151549 RepID=A0A4C1W7H0_EUMVA|nr:hypothetical protein EVAR_41438_1 [Eumeta japonica]